MRIELLVQDGKHPTNTYLGYIFTDAHPELDRCFSPRFWQSGAVKSARILTATGWKNRVTREELQKMLTEGEDPARAKHRAMIDDAENSTPVTMSELDVEELKAKLRAEVQAEVRTEMRKIMEEEARLKLAGKGGNADAGAAA